jgi:hypothetical protein
MKVTSILLCCLILATAATPTLGQMGWCWGLDYLRTSVEGGVILITHENALYNCCPDRFDYSIDLDGNVISVVETEILTLPCACICCYAIPVEVGPVPPGQYQIDFFWQDETGPRHTHLEVTVPEWAWRGEMPGRDTAVDPPQCQDEPQAASVPDPLGHDPSTISAPELTACYPNPARRGVTILYELPEDGPVRLAIFGPGGAQIRDLFDGRARTGANSMSWDGKDDAGTPVAAGVYYCRLVGESGSSHRRLIVLH